MRIRMFNAIQHPYYLEFTTEGLKLTLEDASVVRVYPNASKILVYPGVGFSTSDGRIWRWSPGNPENRNGQMMSVRTFREKYDRSNGAQRALKRRV